MAYVYQVSPRKKKSFFGKLSTTTLIVIINVVFFILVWSLLYAGVISENFFSENIAVSLDNIVQLRIWTLLTSMFMHGNFFHLFVNMLSLFFIGSLVEKILGKKRYWIFYLAAGLFASLLYLIFEILFPSGLGAVGASGALFGLIGLLVLLTPDLPVYVMFIPIPIKMKYAGPGILILLWVISITANLGIGNTAHLGGLLVGLAYGFYLRNKYKNKTRYISRKFS